MPAQYNLSRDQFPATFYHGSRSPDIEIGTDILPAPPTRSFIDEAYTTEHPDAAYKEAIKNSRNRKLSNPVRIWEVKPLSGLDMNMYPSEVREGTRNFASRHGWRVTGEYQPPTEESK